MVVCTTAAWASRLLLLLCLLLVFSACHMTTTGCKGRQGSKTVRLQIASGSCCSPPSRQYSWTSALSSIQTLAPVAEAGSALTRTRTSMQMWGARSAPSGRIFPCSFRRTLTVRPKSLGHAACGQSHLPALAVCIKHKSCASQVGVLPQHAAAARVRSCLVTAWVCDACA